MNKVILMGRLTKDPEIRDAAGTTVGRYSLAVDRRHTQENQQTADFINVVTFGKAAEFAEKYLKKGTKVLLTGRLQTGSYTNKDGVKVYTTDVIAEDQEFTEKKSDGSSNRAPSAFDGFTEGPEGIEDDLPFGPVTR